MKSKISFAFNGNSINRWRSIVILSVISLIFISAEGIYAGILNVGVGQTYTTIQSAVDAAMDDDIINIVTSPITECGITVDVNVTIKGQGKNQTIVQGDVTTGTAADRIFTIPAGTSVQLQDMTISNGYAAEGGAIYSQGTLTVTRCIIRDNITYDGSDGTPEDQPGDPGGNGGGIAVFGGTLNLHESTIYHNTTGSGGNGGTDTNHQTPGGEGGRGGRGGGIYAENCTCDLLNCIFENNTTGNGGTGGDDYGNTGGIGGHGSAMYIKSATADIKDCNCIDNTTGNGGAGGMTDNMRGGTGGYGGFGTLYTSNSTLTCSGTIISGNLTGQGGKGGRGYHSYGTGGHGGQGGLGAGIYALGSDCNVKIWDVEIAGNVTGDGGVSGDAWGSGSHGRGGKGGFGAGIYTRCNAVMDLVNVGVRYNTTGNGGDSDDINYGYGGTGGHGGGIYVADANLCLTNVTISGNKTGDVGQGLTETTGGGGAGIFDNLTTGVTSLVNCTITGNQTSMDSANGGGILASDGDMTVSNSILWGNSDSSGTDESAQLYVKTTAPVVNYSCIQGLNTFAGNGNIGSDPLFVNPDGTLSENLRLDFGSPCLDAGNNTLVPADTLDVDDDTNTTERTPLDRNGHKRFKDDLSAANTGVDDLPDYPYIVDMGAFERGACGDTDYPISIGDLNGDCIVNIEDLGIMFTVWLKVTGP